VLLNEEIEAFIAANSNAELAELALRHAGKTSFPLPFALDQIRGRRIAAKKIPVFASQKGLVYPGKLSMEQCSSEMTARYKSGIFVGDRLLDMTGGFGVDSYFLAESFKQVLHLEKDATLQKIAAHNFSVLDAAHIESSCTDGIEYLKKNEVIFDCIFIDPARRDANNRKAFLLADCEPNLLEHLALIRSRCKQLLIKLSPMVDLAVLQKELGEPTAYHIVSLRNECKEVLVLFDGDETDTQIHCVNIHSKDRIQGDAFSYKERDKGASYSEPLSYLYEPNRSIQKSGLQNALGKKFGLKKLQAHSQLFTAEEELADFPGRSFRIQKVLGAKKSELHSALPSKRANVVVRNFPKNADQLYKELDLTPSEDCYLLATTLLDQRKVFILAEKI